MSLTRPTHLLNEATHPTQGSTPLEWNSSKEEHHPAYQQGSGKNIIIGVHGRSRRAANRQQWTARRLDHTQQRTNHQQRNGRWQRHSDDREVRGTGIHIDESPAWTDTQQPKREPTIKGQTASTWQRWPINGNGKG